MSNEITAAATGDVQKYIKAAYVEALRQTQHEEAEKAERSTVASRKKALAKAVNELDVDVLAEVELAFATYLPNLATINPDEVAELTPTQILAIAEEYARFRVASEFLAVRRDAIKELFFGHFDNTVGHFTNGEVPVEEVGLTFRREGAGAGEPKIDQEELKRQLDAKGIGIEEVFDIVEVPEQVIPAHTEETFSEEKLLQLAVRKPEVFDLIRKSLVPGKNKDGKFVVRELKDN